VIKELFFTAALLVPSLAYAGNPSASLSVQVIPAGSAPAGAQAAGYSTLAFHSDFTQPFYSNLSNWLDCAGAASPQWWIGGGNGQSPPPCSRISMINDGGMQVMDMRFTAADAGSLGTVLTTLNALGQRYSQGVDFPNGAYWQATFRVLPNGLNNNPFGTLIAAWWSWSDTGQSSGTAFQERDFLEEYGTGCCHNDAGLVEWNAPSGQTNVLLAGFGQPEYQIDPTVYHTIAARVTQDGRTNEAMCLYIDGVLQNCRDMIGAGNTGGSAITSSQLNQRNYPILQIGPLNATPVAATIDMLVQDVQIWTCSAWQGPLNRPGNACNGPVLTGAP